MYLRSVLAIACFSFIFPLHAQDIEQGNNSNPGPRVVLRQVKDSIYMLQGQGGNVGIFAGQEGGLMIDNQFAKTSGRLMESYNHISNSPLKFLINTHHHGDHTGGNANFKAMGVTIISHKNVRRHLMDEARAKIMAERDAAFKERVETLRESGSESSAADLTAKGEQVGQEEIILEDIFPSLTIDNTINFYLNGEEIEIIPLAAGHTDGDMLVWFKTSNVIHTGDAYIKSRYPYIDSKNGGTPEGYMAGLKKIMGLIDDNTKIIPGHGDLASKANLKESIRMFESIIEDVTFHAYSGKSLEEVQAMSDITKKYDDLGYGDYFITKDQFIAALYAAPAAKFKAAKK